MLGVVHVERRANCHNEHYFENETDGKFFFEGNIIPNHFCALKGNPPFFYLLLTCIGKRYNTTIVSYFHCYSNNWPQLNEVILFFSFIIAKNCF